MTLGSHRLSKPFIMHHDDDRHVVKWSDRSRSLESSTLHCMLEACGNNMRCVILQFWMSIKVTTMTCRYNNAKLLAES